MKAAGETLTVNELAQELIGPTWSARLYVAHDGEMYEIERADVDSYGIVMYTADTPLDPDERIAELERALERIAAGGRKSTMMTKAEIIAAAKAVL